MSFGYMNINTNLVERSRKILEKALDKEYGIPKNWIRIAQNEGFKTMADWIRKELAIVNWELETRRRIEHV